jgi:hypothetical protein
MTSTPTTQTIIYDIVPICRGSWWERMTISQYTERQTLSEYDAKLIEGMDESQDIWAFVHESEGIEYLQGLTIKMPEYSDEDY